MSMLAADFDWVKARNECSIAAVFKLLQTEAEKNIDTRNAQLTPQETPFKFVPGNDQFFVMRGNYATTFILSDTDIRVEDTDRNPFLKATLTLNDAGECKLKVDGAELERWQFLRKALEDFFFLFRPKP